MTYKEIEQYTHIRIIQTGNKYAVLLRVSEETDFEAWNKEADPLRWAVMWDTKEVEGHSIMVRSGRQLDRDPSFILRADPDTGDIVPYINISAWWGGLFYRTFDEAQDELDAMAAAEQENTTVHSEPIHAHCSHA